MRAAFLIGLLALPLAACDDSPRKSTGTAISIDATTDENEAVSIKADGATGKVAVKLPGFEGALKLPKGLIDASKADISGVKLYPGSTVGAVNIKADNRGPDKKALVDIAFTSPAEPAKVAAYLRQAFAEKKITLSGPDTALTGKTEDGNDFTFALTAAGTDKTEGRISIVDSGS